MGRASQTPIFEMMSESLARALAGEPVCVGTVNAAKCEAVRSALVRLRSETDDARPQAGREARPTAHEPGEIGPIEILPIAVPSGVAEQPLGFDEIVRGARNRARAAFARRRGVMAVGIEDGLVRVGDGAGGDAFFNFGCAWVYDGSRESRGFSSGFHYPPECLEPATERQLPIGELFDSLWRRRRDADAISASGPNEGNIGRLTGGRLTRSDYGSHAVLCALVRFLHEDLYD